MHKGFSPLYNRKLDDQAKAIFRAALEEKFTWVASQLATRPYLAGQSFGVADAYLFVMLTWMQWVQIDRSKWPVLESWFQKVSARPAVQAALAAEAAAKASARS